MAFKDFSSAVSCLLNMTAVFECCRSVNCEGKREAGRERSESS